MADYGHKWTDKRLESMEERIGKIYGETVEDAKTRLKEILETFEKADKEKADLVAAGKMKQRNYIAWRQETLGKAKHLQDMIGILSEDFTNADKIAMRIVSGEALDVYAMNANYAAYEIEQRTNLNLSWSLYDRSTVERLIKDTPDLLPLPAVDIPMDMRWNRQHITEAITKGILLGDPIPEIAKRLQGVANMGYHAAVRSARTATTAAECAGRTDTYKQAEKMGIQLKQMWVATLDGRTRHEHRQADGQMVDIGKPFVVDGIEMEFPGDPKAPGYLIYNCRCTVISVDKFHDPNAPRASKLGSVSYEEWKAEKEVAEGNRWGTYSKSSESAQKSIDNSVENGIIVSSKPDNVSSRNSAYGKPNLVNAGAPLSKKQKTLLDSLQNDGDTVTVKKKQCSMKDLSALTAHEGVEFALLTKNGQRMVFRGNDHHVNALNGVTVPAYRDAGWKWSGHTHAYGGLLPSDGDIKILKLFNQKQSAIYDYKGKRGMVFNDESEMD